MTSIVPLAQQLGESPALAAVREQVERLLHRQAEGARRLAPILILGETGTGTFWLEKAEAALREVG